MRADGTDFIRPNGRLLIMPEQSGLELYLLPHCNPTLVYVHIGNLRSKLG